MIKIFMVGLSAVIALALTAIARADDPGYFLSWQQKQDLLWQGRMQDAAGTWYDVWLCPGYVPPARYAREHLVEAGGSFHEYIEADKYRSLKNGSQACFEWALEDCGLDFTVQGIPRAWGRHFSVASERTERRIFGWWMAYPWAFLESTVETAFRAVVGTVGTAGGLASGAVVVPAYHALDSAVVGVWNLGVNTVVIPAVGVGWNTIIGPPLALAGQKPSADRVDGFWVTIVDPERAPARRVLSREEVQQLAEWGILLRDATEPLAQKRDAINRNADARIAQLSGEIQATRVEAKQQRNELAQAERAAIQQSAAPQGASTDALQQLARQSSNRDNVAEIRRYLKGRNVSDEDTQRILELLWTSQAVSPAVPAQVRPKTDPLQRSLEVMGEAVEE
ncbi:MAG: hypothetical protein O3B24_07315 [Verrucomicrobia bacterium]|nr:hypothetical protein [Verrucomicrobiota bacterium]